MCLWKFPQSFMQKLPAVLELLGTSAQGNTSLPHFYVRKVKKLTCKAVTLSTVVSLQLNILYTV